MSNRMLPRAAGGGTPSNPTHTAEAQPAAATITKDTVTNAAAVSLLTANAARKGAILWNDGPADLLVSFGGTASASDYSLKIPGGASGSFYELKFPAYTGSVSAILAALGSQTVRVTEFT